MRGGCTSRSGYGAAWQRAGLGDQRSQVQILLSRLADLESRSDDRGHVRDFITLSHLRKLGAQACNLTAPGTVRAPESTGRIRDLLYNGSHNWMWDNGCPRALGARPRRFDSCHPDSNPPGDMFLLILYLAKASRRAFLFICLWWCNGGS